MVWAMNINLWPSQTNTFFLLICLEQYTLCTTIYIFTVLAIQLDLPPVFVLVFNLELRPIPNFYGPYEAVQTITPRQPPVLVSSP